MSEDVSAKSTKSKKELRKEQIQHIVLAVIALIVIIALCWAWFVSNTRVSGTGAQISSQGSRFELATTGANTGVYDGNKKVEGTGKVIGDKTYYTTSGEKTAVSWMVGADSNLKNTSKNQTLQPNSSGRLDFSVIPLVDDLGTLNFTLKVIPYGVGTVSDEGAVQIDGAYYVPLSEAEEASQLLMGHLLFFSSYNQSSKYVGRLMPSETFQLTPLNTSVAKKLQNYSIYWIWPGYFDQYVTRGTDQSLFSGAEGSNLDYQNMLTNINNQSAHFFINNNASIPRVREDMSSADIGICSNYYNNGDETIGTNVRYVELQLTAAE
ncbi:MAG: hypothetical protein PHW34_03535 [Hespellia sp.]|nr:hypothetical protein [Hespellia sp.]